MSNARQSTSPATMADLVELHQSWVKKFDEMQGLVETLVVAVNNTDADPNVEPRVFRDQFWKCVKCASKLAVYDPKADQLRIKHKDLIAYFEPGTGGKVAIVCRTCGHTNEMTDSRDSVNAAAAVK